MREAHAGCTQTMATAQARWSRSIAFAPESCGFLSAVTGGNPSQIDRTLNDDPFDNVLCLG